MRTFFGIWLYGSVLGFTSAIIVFVLFYAGVITFDHGFYIWAGTTGLGCVLGMFGKTPHMQRLKDRIASLFHHPTVLGDDDVAKA